MLAKSLTHYTLHLFMRGLLYIFLSLRTTPFVKVMQIPDKLFSDAWLGCSVWERTRVPKTDIPELYAKTGDVDLNMSFIIERALYIGVHF